MLSKLEKDELIRKATALTRIFEYEKAIQLVYSISERQFQSLLIKELIKIADSMEETVGKYSFLYQISVCYAELGYIEKSIEIVNQIDSKYSGYPYSRAGVLSIIWHNCLRLGNEELALNIAQNIDYSYSEILYYYPDFGEYLGKRYKTALIAEIQEGYRLGSPSNQRLLDVQDYLGIPDEHALIIKAHLYANNKIWQSDFSQADGREEMKNMAENLVPDLGIDYTQLITLLREEKWREADYETYLLMNRILNRVEYNSDEYNLYECKLRKALEKGQSPEEFVVVSQRSYECISRFIKFPCKELRFIDNLWISSSHGNFGFSVQKQIWFDLLRKFSDPDHVVHQWERHEIETLSPESEVERCRNFKPNKEDELFAEMVGWYENTGPWPGNNWRDYKELDSFNLKSLKGNLPVFWAYQFEEIYRCSFVANGGVMVSFGVGLGAKDWERTGTNFFGIVNSCNL